METINKTDTGKISKEVSLMDVDTVALDDANDAVVIIDQTKLPGTIELVSLRTAQEIWDAIYLLRVRGAPAIGVTAASGCMCWQRECRWMTLTASTGSLCKRGTTWIPPGPRR